MSEDFTIALWGDIDDTGLGTYKLRLANLRPCRTLCAAKDPLTSAFQQAARH